LVPPLGISATESEKLLVVLEVERLGAMKTEQITYQTYPQEKAFGERGVRRCGGCIFLIGHPQLRQPE
jgi:hypothetical protein